MKNENSFLKQKINESYFSTPKKNLKYNQNKKYNLTAIDFENNNFNKDNKKYLLTEFKTNRNNKKQKLLKKNNTLLDSHFLFDKKNNINNDRNNQNNLFRTNYSKLFLNTNNSFINSSYSYKSNNHSNKILKRNNTNYSSKATQSSFSYLNKTEYKNKFNKKEIIKNFDLNFENNKTYNDINLNKVKNIDIHLNKILSKENEIKRKKIEYFLNRKYNNIFKYNFFDSHLNYKPRYLYNNEEKHNLNDEKKKNSYNNCNVKYVNFKYNLDNLVHKIKVIDNNKEFEELVMSLTDEELNYLSNYFNKNILPLLVSKKENKIIDKDVKKYNELKEVVNNGIEKKYLNDNYSNLNASKNSILNDLKQLKNNKKIFPKIIFNKNKNIQKKRKNIYNKNTKIINENSNIIKIENNDIINENKNKNENDFNEKKDINENAINEYKNINENSNNKNNIQINIIDNINEEEKDIYKFESIDKKEQIKNDLKLKVDLSFLGNSNKLNWDLISDKDKKKGILLWNKIIHSKNISKKIKRKIKKTKSLKLMNTLNYPILSEKSTKYYLSKSHILENNKFIKENNDRKRKYSLELNSIDYKGKHLFDDYEDEEEDEDLFEEYQLNKNILNTYNKKNNNKYRNKKEYIKRNNHKKKKNKFINNNEKYEDEHLEEFEDDDSIQYYLNQPNKKNKLLYQKNKINHYHRGVQKNLYFNNYNSIRNINNEKNQINIQTNNKSSKKSLINLTEFLLEKYKLSEGKYSSIDKNIKKELNDEENKNKKIIQYNNKNIKIKEIREKEIKEKEDKIVTINICGLNIQVKNIKNALKNYMNNRKITITELYDQIELKNKLSKLIKKLEKEKKERRMRKYKKKITSFLNKEKANILMREKNEESNDRIIDINRKKKKTFIKKDLVKRKMLLYLKFKNDIEYKIKKGEIEMNTSDIDIFSKLKNNLDKLMNSYNENDIDMLEDFINEEMDLIEQRKIDEKRINGFINNLNEQINLKSMTKKMISEKFCNVVNYNSVNHMNILNKMPDI